MMKFTRVYSQIIYKGFVVRLYPNFAFAFLIALQSNAILAQSENPDTQTFDEILLLTPEQPDQHVQSQVAITWPVLPGESVKELATLFYPKNKKMQHRFIVKTLQLSQDIHPNLDPATASNNANLIVIPNIKYLGKNSGYINYGPPKNKIGESHDKPKLLASYGIKDDVKVEVNSKLQSIYDNLVNRNVLFKQGLDNLNIKLASLTPKLTALKIELIRFFDLALSMEESKNKHVKKKQEAQLQNNLPLEPITQNQVISSTQTQTQTQAPISAPVKAATSRTDESKYISWNIWILVSSLILVIGLSFVMYVRRKLKNFHPVTTLGSGELEIKPVIEYEDSAEQSSVVDEMESIPVIEGEFSGSIPDVEPEVSIDLVKKEEVEQVLEQARIYINLNRFKEAIMLLKTQIQETPKAALHHWFCLLDLYRKSNQKEDFLNDAKQLHENFNIMMPQWEKTTFPSLTASSLEELPHIVERLTALWVAESKVTDNMVETKAYLDELLTDNRSTERIGFGKEVFKEIMLLRDMLDIRLKLSLDG
ncbi:MAG: hypothetical protein Q8K83_03205 [Methylotenera sp.]|nr:hypothetical protein [Methylotenera sp.]